MVLTLSYVFLYSSVKTPSLSKPSQLKKQILIVVGSIEGAFFVFLYLLCWLGFEHWTFLIGSFNTSVTYAVYLARSGEMDFIVSLPSWTRSGIIRTQDSLVLYKLFNTLLCSVNPLTPPPSS